MIQYTKSRKPRLLRDKADVYRKELEDAYDADPAAYDRGERVVSVRATYRAKTVKRQIMADQHDKCCFCEGNFTANAHGDVEHYRPKKGWQQSEGQELQRPGYYWLSYDWDNLLFACEICNGSHKGNLFPLADPAKRVRNHHAADHLDGEEPILLNPYCENPEEHIGFREEVIHDKTDRGKRTIDICGLDRKRLEEDRRDHLKVVKLAMNVAWVLGPRLAALRSTMTQAEYDQCRHNVQVAKDFLAAATTDAGPFAGMVRANLASLPRS